ncbi:hypothetical protein HYV86_02375 [Candidatus Woesearchaeota archaeon]|nr:hypothetical protein [Candidatus Woesearchaeota archaeon]
MVDRSRNAAELNELESSVRRAFGNQYSNYKQFTIQKSWETGHARLDHFTLKRTGHRLRHFILKQFIPSTRTEPTSIPLYDLVHNPGRLYQAELRNLQRIRRHAALFDRDLAKQLVPIVYGSDPETCTIVMEYVRGQNSKNIIAELARQIPADECQRRTEGLAKLNKTFLEGIRGIARFDGIVNAGKAGQPSSFLVSQDYLQERELNERINATLFLQNLQALAGHLYEGRVPLVVQKTNGWEDLQTALGNFDLEQRLTQLREMRSVFREPIRAQHRDCNGMNQIGTKMVDLEDFGLDGAAEDLSSYCTVLGLANNAIFRSNDLPYFIQTYLALSDAYQHQNETAINTLENAKNGESKRYIQGKMDEQEYARFMLSFFDRSITKMLYLWGSSTKHPDPAKVFGTMRPINKDIVIEILGTIGSLDTYFGKLGEDQAKRARDYFHAQADLIKTILIPTMPEYITAAIRNGSTSGRMSLEDPFGK